MTMANKELVVRDVVLTPASISSYLINKEQIPG
jgi:hypothetical protein